MRKWVHIANTIGCLTKDKVEKLIDDKVSNQGNKAY